MKQGGLGAVLGLGGDVRASLCVESQEGECGPRGQQQLWSHDS